MSQRSASDDLMVLATVRPEHREATLLRATTGLFCQEPIHDRDGIKRYEELAIHFLRNAADADRAYVAALLAGRSDAPGAVMRLLARDRLEIAAPVLRHSPTLSTIDLLGIIAVTGPDHHRLIAARAGLSPDVQRALALARNTATVASPKAAAPPVNTVAVANLPATAAPGDVSPPAPSELAGFLDLPPPQRVSLMGEMAARHKRPTALSTPRRLDRALRHAFAHAEIVAAATARNRPGLVRGFAEALDVGGAIAERLLDDPSGEPLVLMLRATGLRDSDGRTVLLLARPDIGQSVERFYRLADLYASLEPAVAEAFMAAWRELQPERPPRHEPMFAETADRRPSASPTAAPAETMPLSKSA